MGSAMLDMFADAVHNSEIRMAIGDMLGAISFGSLWMFIMLLKDLPKNINE